MKEQSIEEIKVAIDAIEAQKAELLAAVAAKQAEARANILAQMRAACIDNDIDPAEVAAALKPPTNDKRTRRASGTDTRVFPIYCLKSDPQRTYMRGVLPGWLKDAIMAAGLDPAKKEDRERFRADHMAVAA